MPKKNFFGAVSRFLERFLQNNKRRQVLKAKFGEDPMFVYNKECLGTKVCLVEQLQIGLEQHRGCNFA